MSAQPTAERPTPADIAAVDVQLGRVPRGVVAVAHRCACGRPDVLTTEPRLPDGTPFPTTFYATCPKLTGAISTLESQGVMKEMSDRLAADEELASRYAAAHEDYLRRRYELGRVEEIEGISAGGMPTRVKCLHVLAAHSLAAGPGVNPLGDETLALLGDWWASGSCVPDATDATGGTGAADAAEGADAAHASEGQSA
ncbi:DUF501 domain-containing protein [Phycicoccus sp. Root563]|uniref:DUF501 domain-containing protein n=1 Tax=Phycicoccus sp. Root563 TaxID=1736562 RepID=UPI0009E7FA85|nr:DUF501 domain-containing protein [Phycicoccus sp. Root563]